MRELGSRIWQDDSGTFKVATQDYEDGSFGASVYKQTGTNEDGTRQWTYYAGVQGLPSQEAAASAAMAYAAQFNALGYRILTT